MEQQSGLTNQSGMLSRIINHDMMALKELLNRQEIIIQKLSPDNEILININNSQQLANIEKSLSIINESLNIIANNV